MVAGQGNTESIKTYHNVLFSDPQLNDDGGQYLESEEYGDLVRDNHDVVRNVRGAFTPHKLRCVKLGHFIFQPKKSAKCMEETDKSSVQFSLKDGLASKTEL